MKYTYRTITEQRAKEITSERNAVHGGNGIKFVHYSWGTGETRIIPTIVWGEVQDTTNSVMIDAVQAYIDRFGRSVCFLSEETGYSFQEVAQVIKHLVINFPYSYALDVCRTGGIASIHRLRV